MTTRRAYEELERDGFIESYTGRGCFVKAQNTEIYREEQIKAIEALLAEAGDKARKCGITKEELHQLLDLVSIPICDIRFDIYFKSRGSSGPCAGALFVRKIVQIFCSNSYIMLQYMVK